MAFRHGRDYALLCGLCGSVRDSFYSRPFALLIRDTEGAEKDFFTMDTQLVTHGQRLFFYMPDWACKNPDSCGMKLTAGKERPGDKFLSLFRVIGKAQILADSV